MRHLLLILMSNFIVVYSFYTSDYEENTPTHFIEKLNEQDPVNEDEPEPINTITLKTDHTTLSLDAKNYLCEDFEEYANNCTYHALAHYNSTMTLPLHHELKNWCKALQSLATCEYDWNMDCKDVTENNFNELTIQGQLHILDKVCHDDGFSMRYDSAMNNCIRAVSKDWKKCYKDLKNVTDQLKNATSNWTHYKTHFYLCCARTRFRSCTLEILLNYPHNCTPQQSITLQKFSSIVSEGEVFQDCNFNMVYPSCPGGDPRPPTKMVSKLMGEGVQSLDEDRNKAFRLGAVSQSNRKRAISYRAFNCSSNCILSTTLHQHHCDPPEVENFELFYSRSTQ